jgi:hypothetical protein
VAVIMTALDKERCDIRVWSGECKQDDALSTREKYLCKQCGIIGKLEHEVCHDFYSYVSGDYKNLS